MMDEKPVGEQVNIFWFRRDLRLQDNAGLFHALSGTHPVLPLFIFDTDILDKLEVESDQRVTFIYDAIQEMRSALINIGSGIEVIHGRPIEIFKALTKRFKVAKVFTNHDYEPYATERDEAVRGMLNEQGITFHTFKDQVIFEKSEVVKDDGSPYLVFTPYSRKWKMRLNQDALESYSTEKHFDNFYRHEPSAIPSLKKMGFTRSKLATPSPVPDLTVIKNYDKQRDFPGIEGTSRMGVHLRFGTISVRELARIAERENSVYMNELIWREFYQMVLWNFPKVGKGHAFKKEYDNIQWRLDESDFKKWCEGNTGYPLVDAGMRQLNATGFMHNRIRMVTASFLAKHLLIDWRWGEAYFAQKLLDYDLAANNGGWQWAAGTGCDAAPYFRIFNPTLQAKKFDPGFKYIRMWVPEFEGFNYPKPMVEHEFARKRCLEAYKSALGQ